MREKKWLVYDSNGVLAGWFGSEAVAEGFANEIGGSVRLVYV